MTTFGKSKFSGEPKLAPKIPISKGKSGNYMRESDKIKKNTSAQSPMRAKKLSK